MGTELAGYLQIAAWPPVPDALFWSALILVGGGLLGEAVHRGLAWPRLMGYSAAGMVIALMGHGLDSGQLTGGFKLVVDLALALLLFELGSRVNLRWLRSNPALLWTSMAETVISFAAIFIALRWFGLSNNIALTCATLTVCASPAVVGRVATELKSSGQVTERMIVHTAINTLVAVLSHRLVTSWLHLDGAGDWLQAVVQPLYAFGGSVVLALLLAKLVALVARRLELRDENSVLLLLGLIVLALTLSRMFNLSTLLVPLLAGVMLRNLTERPWVWPRHFGTAGGVLVLMLFVIVGGAWSLDSLANGALAAAVLLLARFLGKAVAVVGLAPLGGITFRQGAALSLALTPLSGTTLVLLAELHVTHPQFAPTVTPIVLSAIAFMQLAGPLALQWGLRWTGEHQPKHRAS